MMLAQVACGKRVCPPFGRLSGPQPSAWIWAWSWDPLRFARRHPPHHLSPARVNHPAGQDPEAASAAPSHHSNAPIKPESQSNLSKIVALTPKKLLAPKQTLVLRQIREYRFDRLRIIRIRAVPVLRRAILMQLGIADVALRV